MQSRQLTPVPPAPEDGVWLLRLRRGDRQVITTIGLSRTAAEHLAEQVIDLLADTQETLDRT